MKLTDDQALAAWELYDAGVRDMQQIARLLELPAVRPGGEAVRAALVDLDVYEGPRRLGEAPRELSEADEKQILRMALTPRPGELAAMDALATVRLERDTISPEEERDAGPHGAVKVVSMPQSHRRQHKAQSARQRMQDAMWDRWVAGELRAAGLVPGVRRGSMYFR